MNVDARWERRVTGGWIDETNLMLIEGGDDPRCTHPPPDLPLGLGVFGQTYSIRAPDPPPLQNGQPDPRAGQNPHRSTITLTHTPTIGRLDIHGLNSYGWSNIYPMTINDALRNSDSYAYFALWALLADKGYTLPRYGNPPTLEALADTVRGKLYLYHDLTGTAPPPSLQPL
ncbi:MAG: hypothetical protein Q9227_005573 [Pyrenula ochraceoflavens]